MIFYIHGLGGGEKSATYQGLKKHFADVVLLAYPSESAEYAENLRVISEKFFYRANFSENVVVVGTSLGGFFATKLADLCAEHELPRLRLLLVNPAATPFKTASGLGYPKELVDTYKGVEISHNAGVKKIVVLADDDELLNPDETAAILSPCRLERFARGGHSCWNTLGGNIAEFVRELEGA